MRNSSVRRFGTFYLLLAFSMILSVSVSVR